MNTGDRLGVNALASGIVMLSLINLPAHPTFMQIVCMTFGLALYAIGSWAMCFTRISDK